VGKASQLRPGNDLAILATGTAVRTALEARKVLAREGIDARVLNFHTIKPIDREAIELAASETGLLLTVEEHSTVGGLGTATSEVLSEFGRGRLRRLGIPDRFCTEVAPYKELLQACGLDVPGVAAAARELIAVRGS
jgi:transketolase